jgi:hypothetical protein
MRALGSVLAGLLLGSALAACGGAGSPPVQVAPTNAPPAASGAPAAPAASPAGTMAPDAQDDYDY